jgi:hypothetical protein
MPYDMNSINRHPLDGCVGHTLEKPGMVPSKSKINQESCSLCSLAYVLFEDF